MDDKFDSIDTILDHIKFLKGTCTKCGAACPHGLSFCWSCYEDVSKEVKKYLVPLEAPKKLYSCIFCDALTAKGHDVCDSCKDAFMLMKHAYTGK